MIMVEVADFAIHTQVQRIVLVKVMAVLLAEDRLRLVVSMVPLERSMLVRVLVRPGAMVSLAVSSGVHRPSSIHAPAMRQAVAGHTALWGASRLSFWPVLETGNH